MNKTKIEWADYVFNPVTGCLHNCTTPDGYSYCYARRQCFRFARPWGLDPADPFKPTFHPERLEEPSYIKKPSRIFVCNMAELFGEWVHRPWIEKIIMRADLLPRHTFIFLTKNPRRYAEFDFPPNCWLGVTVTGSDRESHQRIDDLLGRFQTDNKGPLFVSYEPILGPYPEYHYGSLSWFTMGAMSGPGTVKYAPNPHWIRRVVRECRIRHIPVFMKNSIRPYWDGELIRDFPK